MPSRDANDATWYVLRYPEDFRAPGGAPPDPRSPFARPSTPYLEPTLRFDERRGRLELQPEASPSEAGPPPGIAPEPGGEVYRVAGAGHLEVVLCDGSTRTLPCEPGVLARPAGLALDRRGLLHVADPAARRVVVLATEGGSARAVAILGGGGPVGPLVEPVDVATSPSGPVFVADRAGGRVAVFSASMRPLRAFPTESAPGKPARPIAVMVEADGSLLVADAWLPRLQHYTPDGSRLADVDLAAVVGPLIGGDLALGAYGRAFGDRLPRLLIGSCGPCEAPADDLGARLAEVHRAIRLLGLALGRRFAPSGAFISRALDGGRPGVPWHRVEVELDGDPPAGSRVTVETSTSDSPTPEGPDWAAPRDKSGAALPFTADRPEQLIRSPRGRFLWARVTLSTGEGQGTPSIRAIRVRYPRVGYLDLLPAAYRSDPESAAFLDGFLSLFERVFTGVEDRYVEFSRELNPDAAPAEVVAWLGALVDLAFDPSWPLGRRRALLGEAMALYRARGTVAGIERYVEVYTGIRPRVVEGWLERPARPAYLGRPGAVLGCGLPLLARSGPASSPPEDELWARHAHRFTLYVYLDDRCDAEVTLRAVDRIVEANKPAHAAHRVEAVYPDARVGLQSRVGLDLVLGAAPSPSARVGPLGGPAGVLGVGTVLGARRPGAAGPLDGWA